MSGRLRVLSAAEVRRALPMTDAIAAVREAFAQLSAGRVEIPPRTRMRLGSDRAHALVMPGYAPEARRLGVKVVALHQDNAGRGLPYIHASMLLLDAADGRPLALLDAATLTALRTGAASGLATELLARADSRVAVIFGAGTQARTQLEAVCAVRPIERALVFDPDTGRSARYAEQMGARLGIPVSVAGSPAVVSEADVVCTATTSLTPVFPDADLRHGSHVNAIGAYRPDMRELPAETLRRCRLFVDSREACLEEAGDVMAAIRDGVIRSDHVEAELGELVERPPAARAPGDVTVFKSVGSAAQDLFAAQRALVNAEGAGLGSVVDV